MGQVTETGRPTLLDRFWLISASAGDFTTTALVARTSKWPRAPFTVATT